MFLYRQGNFVLKLFEPSLFLLIHDQNSHPANCFTVSENLGKNQRFYVPVGGNPVIG